MRETRDGPLPEAEPAKDADPAPRATLLLERATGGDPRAADELSHLLYDQLRAMARGVLGGRGRLSLQPTELVHEAYLRLVDQTRVRWNGRSHFLAVAARVMRRVVSDYARRRGAAKRGGDLTRVSLAAEPAPAGARVVDALDLDAVLSRLEAADARRADVVTLRIFGGLTTAEAAEALELSPRTVEREWAAGRAFLVRELRGASPA